MERNEKSKQWLLKDQERRLEHLDEWQEEYEQMNITIGNIKVMVADLVIEEKRVDDQMTNLRYRINAEEKKIREINKMLRDKNDIEIANPKDWEGDRSNV